MSIGSVSSRITRNDNKFHVTQIAHYKGTLVAVKAINKQSVTFTRSDLVEMKQVTMLYFLHSQPQ